MKRLIIHWTAGTHKVSDLDRKHYHFIINGAGETVLGTLKPEDNLSTDDGVYAAHTLHANTGAIGVSVAAMAGAVERPFNAGKFPITNAQISSLAKLCATLCRKYDIPLNGRSVLTHAEVQPTLDIPQKGKWDITWLPGMAKPGDPVAVGNKIRAAIAVAMQPSDTMAGAPLPGSGVFKDRPKPPTPAPVTAKPAKGFWAGLFAALAALFGGKK